MSRIFKIFGNFTQYGKWSEPDPSFVGEIVVDDNNLFCGYCNELNGSNMLIPKIDNNRFIAGVFAPNGRDGKTGIAFYKTSNFPFQCPLLYVVPNLVNSEDGLWGSLDRVMPNVFNFTPLGMTKIIVEEVPYTGDREKRIESKFGKDNKNIKCNDLIIEMLQYCVSTLANTR